MSLTTPQRGRVKGQRARGSGRKTTAPGCLIISMHPAADERHLAQRHSFIIIRVHREVGVGMLVSVLPPLFLSGTHIFPALAGGRAEKKRGKAAGRGRRGRARGPEPKDHNASKPVSRNTDDGDTGDDIDWEPAS